MSPSNNSDLGLLRTAASAGLGGCCAEFMTIPLDTAKVRLQVAAKSAVPGAPRMGLLGTLGDIVKNEGVHAPWKGVTAGFQRQLVFASLRISLYQPIRDFYCGKDFKGEAPLYLKIAAGMTSGGLGMLVANPTDLVKVRLQGDARRAPGTPPRYKGALNAYSTIVRTEGFGKLWTGVGPNVMRNCVINAAEMAAYDQFKSDMKRWNLMSEGPVLHFVAGLWAGFCATVAGSPVDVIKTRVMNAKPGQYSGVFDCVRNTAAEGPAAFYKGFGANFARIGSFNVAIFVFFEQFKELFQTYAPPAKH